MVLYVGTRKKNSPVPSESEVQKITGVIDKTERKASVCQQRGSQRFCLGRGLLMQREEGMHRRRAGCNYRTGKRILTAPAATFGKCPWDSEGSDEARFSYFTLGNISSFFS